jgi:CheY-like chemotaxis protein
MKADKFQGNGNQANAIRDRIARPLWRVAAHNDSLVSRMSRIPAASRKWLARSSQPLHDQIEKLRSGMLAVAKILIVDDDPAVRATIRLLLERAGHDVVVAGDGRNGLAMFETLDIDLLLLDIFMPGMDGIETMRSVHRRRPHLPIVVISGNPIFSDSGIAPDFLTMAVKLGAVSSLQKPFTPAALLDVVARGLDTATRPSSPAATINSSGRDGDAR